MKKQRFRPLVYICSPYRGEVEENTKRAREYCRFALDQGQIPLAPHLLYPQFMDDEELAAFIDAILLGKCQELWVFGDVITEGMKAEIQVAKRRRQKIRYFTDRLQEVATDE